LAAATPAAVAVLTWRASWRDGGGPRKVEEGRGTIESSYGRKLRSVRVQLWVELKTEERKAPGTDVDVELGTLKVKVWMVDAGWRVDATISTSRGKESCTK